MLILWNLLPVVVPWGTLICPLPFTILRIRWTLIFLMVTLSQSPAPSLVPILLSLPNSLSWSTFAYGCWGQGKAASRYLTTAYWLFQTKIFWEAARGSFWLSSPSLNAGNRSPCDRCPPWSWILRDNIAKSYKTQSLKSPYK